MPSTIDFPRRDSTIRGRELNLHKYDFEIESNHMQKIESFCFFNLNLTTSKFDLNKHDQLKVVYDYVKFPADFNA